MRSATSSSVNAKNVYNSDYHSYVNKSHIDHSSAANCIPIQRKTSLVAYKLVTVNILRKYCGLFDILLSLGAALALGVEFDLFTTSSSQISNMFVEVLAKNKNKETVANTYSQYGYNTNKDTIHIMNLSVCDIITLWCAMYQHYTQLVWYRILYMVLSRYCYINSLERI